MQRQRALFRMASARTVGRKDGVVCHTAVAVRAHVKHEQIRILHALPPQLVDNRNKHFLAKARRMRKEDRPARGNSRGGL